MEDNRCFSSTIGQARHRKRWSFWVLFATLGELLQVASLINTRQVPVYSRQIKPDWRLKLAMTIVRAHARYFCPDNELTRIWWRLPKEREGQTKLKSSVDDLATVR